MRSDFAIFQNHGYKGLYGGLDAKGIHQRKGLKKNQQILDNMGSTELAANLFRATQTEEKLRREKVQSKTHANTTHFEVGKKVRQTIQELGGTMPEDLPKPDEDLRKLENGCRKCREGITMICDECSVMSAELKNNSYFIIHNSELAVGVMTEKMKEIQR